MTTDVINGVPRELLEHICDATEGLEFSSGFCLGICDDLRTLLATAQPAADGERGEYGDAYQGAREDLAIWKRRALEAESKVREQDRIIENLGNALNDENGPTFMGEPVLQARAAQPQQAVAVTDEVRRLREAKAEWAKYKPDWLVVYLREETAFDADVIGEMLSFAIDAALSAHKTGEEE